MYTFKGLSIWGEVWLLKTFINKCARDTHYVTTFFRVDVAGDVVHMNHEHDEYTWVSELPDDAHPLVREIAERAGIFEK
jgi:hypothetical protein